MLLYVVVLLLYVAVVAAAVVVAVIGCECVRFLRLDVTSVVVRLWLVVCCVFLFCCLLLDVSLCAVSLFAVFVYCLLLDVTVFDICFAYCSWSLRAVRCYLHCLTFLFSRF